jgi:predicted lipoprotein with Yx(FWY)xxD motif
MNRTLTHRRSLAVALGGAVAALVVAGCGGGNGSSSNATAAGPASQSVTTHTGKVGTYLTDGAGRSLYQFSADKGTTSTCTGGCAKEWMPFTASGKPAAAGGVNAAKIGTTVRDGGQRQVTYAGHPLYYFAGDSTAGQTSGQGLDDFGGVWSVVTPAGTAVAAGPGSTSSGSPDYGNGGGYGG